MAGASAFLMTPPALILPSIVLGRSPDPIDISTEPGERRVVRLPEDHGSLTVGPCSRLSVEFGEYRRAITLHAGDILVEFISDALRPLIIQGGLGRAWAAKVAACAFSHSDELHQTVITAVTGIITASRLGDEVPREVDLSPGQQLIIRPRTPLVPRDVNLEKTLMWTQGKINFDLTPVDEAIYQMNRVNGPQQQVQLPDHLANRDFRVTGTFRLDDPKAFERVLIRQFEKHNPR
jgi:transmembrane sensor